jgi:hypothetical protein
MDSSDVACRIYALLGAPLNDRWARTSFCEAKMAAMNWRPKTYGKLMIAVVLLWQVVAVLHLVIAIHTLCPVHGDVAHADGESGELEHRSSVPHSEEHGCFVLMALAANGGMPNLDTPVVQPPESYALEPREARAVSVVLEQRYRFRLSPSQSPPTQRA